MKQDVAEYLVDSFIDYKGEEHKIVICALSQTPDEVDGDRLMVVWSDGDTVDESADIYHDVYRAVSLGIAICCPGDIKSFTEEIGKKIAFNRAEKAIPKFVSLECGVVNTTLIHAFLRQEMEFIKRSPERFINGYEDSKNRYEMKLNLEKEVKNLSNDEAAVVQAAMDGIDIVKCAKLARQLLDRQIRALEKNN